MGIPFATITSNLPLPAPIEVAKPLLPPSGKRNFASLLQQSDKPLADKTPAGQTPPPETGSKKIETVSPTEKTSGAKLERLRQELMQQIKPGDADALNTLLPRLLADGSHARLLRAAMQSSATTPTSQALTQRFGTLEGEWAEIEKILSSDKTLSDGELLGLQARLYQMTQHLEVMSKVIDQMNSGVKTILNTNV